MKKFLVIAAIAASLAACGGDSDKDEDDEDDKSPRAEETGSPSPGLFDQPSAAAAGGGLNLGGSADTMAAGKWSIATEVVSGMGAGTKNTTETCVSSDRSVTDAQVDAMPDDYNCPVKDFQRTGAGMTGKLQCTMQGMKMEMDMVMSGDFRSAFTTDITMKMDMSAIPGAAQSGMNSMTMQTRQTFTRIGDC